MKQIKLLFLLASASVTGVFAQSNGLTDMSQSRYAKMANTGINAVHWTNGFWGGMMWLLFTLTHDEEYKKIAVETEEKMDDFLTRVESRTSFRRFTPWSEQTKSIIERLSGLLRRRD